MLKFKCVTMMAVLFILAIGFPIRAEVLIGESSSSPSDASRLKIMKVVGIVNKIEKNTLYLQSGKKYNLSGVKVEYAKGKPLSKNKEMAEMFFVSGTLKEVTIR